jgi:1-acyl-sn-glycerol-3-phosphate acyltransferase
MDQQELLDRAGERGVNRLVLGIVRLLFLPFFLIWFREDRIGREHIPKDGPVIIAANHRSFLDPFVIAACTRRPFYFVAKKELFLKNRLQTWFLNSLGAFPIDRGTGDEASMATARRILERGDGVMIFPEGTRVRPGPLGHPRRGVGRLALETGAVVVPAAVIGSAEVRRGWRIRPKKVRVRCGPALHFPKVERPSAALAKAVTDRIWPCVELQWEWLGGTPPLRRVAVIGAGSWGTSLAIALARGGTQVELGCRTEEQARELGAERENRRYLPGVRLPDTIRVARAGSLELREADLVCLAVPTRDLPVAMGEIGDRLGSRTSLLVSSKGLVDRQIRARDRIAVRIVRRVAEPVGDQRLQLLGDVVLQDLGLVVDAVPRHAELRQKQLEQAVVPDHLERDAPAVLGQRDAVVGLVRDEAELGEPADHPGRGGRGDPEPLGERVGRDLPVVRAALERVDRLRVVLDSGRGTLGNLVHRTDYGTPKL